jgi:tol-pal system protein YbgF
MKIGVGELALFALAVSLCACATTPGQDDPVMTKLNQLDARLNRLEQAVQNQVTMVTQVQAAQTEMREVRGLIEEVQHDLDGVSKRQRNLYVDVDGRLQQLENSPRVTTGGNRVRRPQPTTGRRAAKLARAPSAGDGNGQGTTDRDAYQGAIALLREGHYQQAAGEFNQFLDRYPDSQFADNAQYWYGETFYVTRKFSEALAAFQKVVSAYPNSQKVSDALLKIGYCDYELGYWDAARAALTRVTNEFTDTTAAHLAQRRLEQMTSEGH